MTLPARTLIISGVDVTDNIFTLDARITGHEISWNVTRALRDARAGLFGPPEIIRYQDLPQPSHEDDQNIDFAKVDAIKKCEKAMREPCMAIEHHTGAIFCFIDGNHRIAAHYSEGQDFPCWIIPHWLESRYRVHFEELHAPHDTTKEDQIFGGRGSDASNSPPKKTADHNG